MIGVDWGTSSLRGALIDATGQVLAERSSADGIQYAMHAQMPQLAHRSASTSASSRPRRPFGCGTMVIAA